MSVPLLTIVSAINDASALMSALTPLVTQALNKGETEVTLRDVEIARLKLTTKIDALDVLIAKAKIS